MLPGRVGLQEGAHPRHRVDRHTPCAHDLAPQVHETGVVSDVGVCQQDPVGAGAGRLRAHRVEGAKLLGQVGGRVDDPAASGPRVHDPE